jgi:hypothetical protein
VDILISKYIYFIYTLHILQYILYKFIKVKSKDRDKTVHNDGANKESNTGKRD